MQCVDCQKLVTWQLQKGRYYGACQRKQAACKYHRMIREDYLEDLVGEELKAIGKQATSREILQHIEQKLSESHHPYIGQHRRRVASLIQRQIQRSEAMESNLYEDKLSGAISIEAHQQKQKEIEIRRSQLKDRLSRIELVEGRSKPVGSSTHSIIGLYESESKQGKRMILAMLFKMSLVDGRVNIQNIWSKK